MIVKGNKGTIINVYAKLNMTQQEIFRTTCFDHFLDIEEYRFRATLIHAVLFFLINHRDPTRKL